MTIIDIAVHCACSYINYIARLSYVFIYISHGWKEISLECSNILQQQRAINGLISPPKSIYHLSLSRFPLHHTLEEKLMPGTALHARLYTQIFLVYLSMWIILNAPQNIAIDLLIEYLNQRILIKNIIYLKI